MARLTFQFDVLFSHKIVGEEDCLVVNVYVPGDASRQRSELLPVMFWIHGGAFFLGSGTTDFYGPERFMDHGVVWNLYPQHAIKNWSWKHWNILPTNGLAKAEDGGIA